MNRRILIALCVAGLLGGAVYYFWPSAPLDPPNSTNPVLPPPPGPNDRVAEPDVSDPSTERDAEHAAERYFGYVTDADTGAAIAGARVTLLGSYSWLHLDEIAVTRTDERGRYGFPAVDRGVTWINVAVSSPGYVPHDTRFREVSGRHADHGRRFETVKLARGIAVTGVVVDGEGLPVAGARVLNRLLEYGVTDAEGAFEIHVEPDGLRLQATAPGMISDTLFVEVEDPTPLRDVELRLQPCHQLEGIVVDEDGRPVAEAFVVVEAHVQSAAMTGEDGRFVLDHVTRSSVKLAVRSDRHLRWEESVTPASGPVTVRLTRGAVYEFRLQDEQGELVQPTECWLRGDASAPCPLRSGSYRSWPVTVMPASTSLRVPDHASRSLDLPGGAGVHDLGTLTVSKRNQLFVTVVDASGRPIPEFQLFFESEKYEDHRTYNIDAPPMFTNGVGRLTGLPLGEGHVKVMGANLAAEKHAVEIVEDEQSMRITLDGSSALVGRIVDSAGDPIVGARARVYDMNAEAMRHAEADTEGRFRLDPLRRGVLFSADFQADGFRKEERGVEMSAPEVDIGDVVLSRGARIRGLVVDDAGAAVPSARIELDYSSADVESDDRGEFLITGKRFAKYHVTAEKDGYLSATVEVDAQDEAERFVTLRLEKGVPFSGFVRSLSGRPIPRVDVTVQCDRPHYSEKTRTRRDGSFSLAGVPNRPVTLWVFHMLEQPHRFAADGPSDLPVEIRIPMGGSVRVVPRGLESAEGDVIVGIGVGPPILETMEDPFTWKDFSYPGRELVVSGLMPGKAHLKFFADGFAETEAIPIELVDEAELVVTVDVEPLPPLEEVRVRVVDAAGNPVPFAKLELYRAEGRNWYDASTNFTDGHGEQILELGPGRDQSLELSAPGFGHMEIDEPFERARNGVLDIVMERGAGLDLTMTWTKRGWREPEVVIRAEDGSDSEWIDPDDEETGDETWKGRWTDLSPGGYVAEVSLGNLRIAERRITLAPGVDHEETLAVPDPWIVRVEIDGPDWLMDPDMWDASEVTAVSLGRGRPVHLDGDEVRPGVMELETYSGGEFEITYTNHRLALQQRFRRSISGPGAVRLQVTTTPRTIRVEDADGLPLGGLSGDLINIDAELHRRFTTDEAGRSDLRHIEAGRYYWECEDAPTGLFPMGCVAIEGGADVTLVLRPTAPFTLRVAGDPPTYEWIVFIPGIESHWIPVGDTSRSELTLPLPLGRYELSVRSESRLALLDIENTEEPQVLTFALEPSARILVGLDVTELGNVAGAVLRIASLDGPLDFEPEVFGKEGQIVTTEPLAPGMYRVSVTLPDGRTLTKTIEVGGSVLHRVGFP